MKKFKGDADSRGAEFPSSLGGTAVDIDALPPEMLGHILSFLTLSEQLKLATVSRHWQQAVDSCLARCRHFSKDLVPGMAHLTDEMLEKILSRLPGLRSLTGISGTDLDVDIIGRHCPQLVKANLYTFRLDVSALERLCRSCQKLAEISLPKCDEACIETILRGLPELRSLDINISNVSGQCLALLPAALRRLELCGRWDPISLELDDLPSCPALTELDISGLYRAPSSELVKLLSICPRLERLTASECGYLTDVFLERLPEKTPNIRHLSLEGCYQLTANGLKNLGRLKELRKLDLIDTDTTDAVLQRLQGARHLTELIVGSMPFNGPDFSIEMLARLVVSCPSLRRVVPSEMVDAGHLIECLRGQLSPDRDVTVEASEGLLEDMEELPEDGPLHLVPYDDDYSDF